MRKVCKAESVARPVRKPASKRGTAKPVITKSAAAEVTPESSVISNDAVDHHAHIASMAAASFERLAGMFRSDWKEGDKFPQALAFTFTDLQNVFRFFDDDGRLSMAGAYIHIANYCIRLLNHFDAKWPGLVKQFVEPGVAWPVLMDGTSDGMKMEMKRLRDLGVIRKGRSISYSTDEVSVATRLYGYIRSYQETGRVGWMPKAWEPEVLALKARDLKPLDRERSNLRAWWNVAEPMFRSMWGEDFDKEEQFSDYWRSATYRGMNAKEKRSAIRRDIKRNIKQAFKSIAPR